LQEQGQFAGAGAVCRSRGSLQASQYYHSTL